jgi:hypothetical protein
MFLPVTPEDVASALADQISGFVTVIPSGPGKKVVQETVEEGVKQGKKVVKKAIEQSGDEIIEGASKKAIPGAKLLSAA